MPAVRTLSSVLPVFLYDEVSLEACGLQPEEIIDVRQLEQMYADWLIVLHCWKRFCTRQVFPLHKSRNKSIQLIRKRIKV